MTVPSFKQSIDGVHTILYGGRGPEMYHFLMIYVDTYCMLQNSSQTFM